MTDHKHKSKFGAGLMIGAVLGGLAALLFAPKSGDEHRKIVKKKLKQLREQLDEWEVEKKAKDIFGDITEQSKKTYDFARKDLAKKLDTMKDALDDIDKEKYKALVEEVIDDVKKGQLEVPSAQLTKLRNYLIEDWNRTVPKSADKVKKGRKNG